MARRLFQNYLLTWCLTWRLTCPVKWAVIESAYHRYFSPWYHFSTVMERFLPLLPWWSIFYLDMILLPWWNIFYLYIILIPWCDVCYLISFYYSVMEHFVLWYDFTAVKANSVFKSSKSTSEIQEENLPTVLSSISKGFWNDKTHKLSDFKERGFMVATEYLSSRSNTFQLAVIVTKSRRSCHLHLKTFMLILQ